MLRHRQRELPRELPLRVFRAREAQPFEDPNDNGWHPLCKGVAEVAQVLQVADRKTIIGFFRSAVFSYLLLVPAVLVTGTVVAGAATGPPEGVAVRSAAGPRAVGAGVTRTPGTPPAVAAREAVEAKKVEQLPTPTGAGAAPRMKVANW